VFDGVEGDVSGSRDAVRGLAVFDGLNTDFEFVLFAEFTPVPRFGVTAGAFVASFDIPEFMPCPGSLFVLPPLRGNGEPPRPGKAASGIDAGSGGKFACVWPDGRPFIFPFELFWRA
jgi:hypothetical protein